MSYRFVNIWLASCFPHDTKYNYIINDCRMSWPSVSVPCGTFHLTEIRRGLCGQVDYRLLDGLQPATSDIVPMVVSHPNDIVAHIRNSAFHDEIEPHDSITAPSSSQSMSPMPSTSSSAATSQNEQQDIEPDDDVDDNHRSQTTSVLTSAEHAATVIHNKQIALDTRLAIFTDNDTSEPRVVQLFPTMTCSCPAKSNCYYILTMSRWWPPVTLMMR